MVIAGCRTYSGLNSVVDVSGGFQWLLVAVWCGGS